MIKKIIQGDVVLTRIDALPNNLKEFNEKSKILQKSEVTGHHHQFKPTAKVKLYAETNRDISAIENLTFSHITPDEGKYIEVLEDALLFHGKKFEYEPYAKGTGDHNACEVPAGTYKVDIVRTFDYRALQTKRVVD